MGGGGEATFLFLLSPHLTPPHPSEPQTRFLPSRKEAVLDLQVEKFGFRLGVVQNKTSSVESWSLDYSQIKTRTSQSLAAAPTSPVFQNSVLDAFLMPEKDRASAGRDHAAFRIWNARSKPHHVFICCCSFCFF